VLGVAAEAILPVGLLNGIDLGQLAAKLSQGVAGLRIAPLPSGAKDVTHTESLTWEITPGQTGLFKVAAQATRKVTFASTDCVPTSQTPQYETGSAAGDQAIPSLSVNPSRALRAGELITSIDRALGEYDITRAHAEGRELESFLTTGSKDDIPIAIFEKGFTILCRVEIALVSQDSGASAMHVARARDFWERAKNATQP